jgi:hypothetical protein
MDIRDNHCELTHVKGEKWDFFKYVSKPSGAITVGNF